MTVEAVFYAAFIAVPCLIVGAVIGVGAMALAVAAGREQRSK